MVSRTTTAGEASGEIIDSDIREFMKQIETVRNASGYHTVDFQSCCYHEYQYSFCDAVQVQNDLTGTSSLTMNFVFCHFWDRKRSLK